MKKIEEYVRSIPDFPEKGIIFRDVTTVLQDAEGLKLAIDSMIRLLDGVEFDVVAGTESRGFIFGAARQCLQNTTWNMARRRLRCIGTP